MKISKSILTVAFILCTHSGLIAQKLTDYSEYHRGIIKAEEFIAQHNYSEALLLLENIFNSYDYVFLKDYKIATQIALYLGNKKKVFRFLRCGISAGWTLKEIKKSQFLKPLRGTKNE